MTKSAHSLKSTSANLGAMSLAELCRELEALGRQDRTDGADKILQEIEQVHPLVCQQLIAVRDGSANDIPQVASANT